MKLTIRSYEDENFEKLAPDQVIEGEELVLYPPCGAHDTLGIHVFEKGERTQTHEIFLNWLHSLRLSES